MYQDTEDYDEFPDYEFYVEDVKVLAKSYINAFFCDKEYYSGGPIPHDLLESHHYLSMVMNVNISDGVDLIYGMLDGQSNKKDEDIKYVLGLLNKCARFGIPKYFAAGIIIMYLELCEGYEAS